MNLLHYLNKIAEAHVHFGGSTVYMAAMSSWLDHATTQKIKRVFRVSTNLYVITSQRETLALFANHVSFNNLSNYGF